MITYLTKVAQKFWLEASPGNLLIQERDLQGFRLILVGLVGICNVYLFHELGEQIFVKVFAKPIRKLE